MTHTSQQQRFSSSLPYLSDHRLSIQRQPYTTMASAVATTANIINRTQRRRSLSLSSLQSSSSSSSIPTNSAGGTPRSQLEDSIWTISYRFSSQPLKDKDDDDSSGSNTQTITERLRRFYSGKITLKFKEDGYTELIESPPSSSSSSSPPTAASTSTGGGDSSTSISTSTNTGGLDIVKVWGWDKETSNEDGKDYLLWSMDVVLPTTDPDLPGQKERFYFQARVDGLALRDGTITVKKDVAEQTSGWWGVFRVGGILSQFRYTGEFVARPSSSS